MSKYFLISDLHLGNNKDSPIFHKITIDYFYWLRDKMREYKASKLIIAGDFLHNRVSINLTTLHVANECLNILNEFEVIMVTGNHECWFLNNSTIHSLAPFKTRKNVHIIDEITTIDNITYCPWGAEVEDIPVNDVIIGHFEAVSFEMTKGKLCTHGIKVSDLMKKCKLAFSGHFHLKQSRVYNGNKFTYLGSCFNLNFGEVGNIPVVHILDPETLDIDIIENTVSPRFYYINNDSDLNKVDGNFISVQIENMDDPLLTKIQSLRPLNIKPHLIEKPIEKIDVNIQEFKVVDINKIIEEYVGCMELTDSQKQLVTERCCKIYKNVV